MAKLSDRHKAFADAYLSNGMNGTRAYLSVYNDVESEDVAKASASRLLTNDNVKEYIKGKQEKKSAKHDITYDYLIEELREVIHNPKTSKGDKVRALKQLSDMLGINADFELKKKLTDRDQDDDDQPTIIINV